MTIEQKMDFVVKRLLGEEYVVVILNDNEFQILKDVKIMISHVMVGKSIEAHWREHISMAIKQILGDKIKNTLNEI